MRGEEEESGEGTERGCKQSWIQTIQTYPSMHWSQAGVKTIQNSEVTGEL